MEKQLRPVRIQTDFTEMAAGSVLIECGRTRVLCTASVEDGAPPFLRGSGRGWLTAEYAMLPGSTPQRKARDGVKRDGRGVEIGRLIGRSLRAACDLSRLGARCARAWIFRGWANARSPSTATFCKRTAARGRLPSRAVLWPCAWRSIA